MKSKLTTIRMISKPILTVPLVVAILMFAPFLSSGATAQEYAAVVVGVDSPEGCLRIRSGPSTATPIIGCSELGSKLRLTGIWSGRWAEVSRPIRGWVYGPQIETDYVPPVAGSGVEVIPPVADFFTYPPYSYGYWDYGWPFRVYINLGRTYGRKHYKHPPRVHQPRHYRPSRRASGHGRRPIRRSTASIGVRRTAPSTVTRSTSSVTRSFRTGGTRRTFSRGGSLRRAVTGARTRVGRTAPRERRRR